ncbi:MAG TPA: DNA polymerase III subunit gamma/tau [Bacteroidales bacterium]|nr:DNA polymerase III subunit gamma/tau [Bacteroidales bacterium]
MENFIVSARKYRPATFDMVVGQDSITNTLKSAIRNRLLAQAYLFCGPRGVGKTTCARIFAKTINCSNLGESGEACDKCESCISFNTLRSFNIHELDAASNNKVDDIRLLTDQVRIPPQVGRYSIYIIDEVHMLSSSAFNAFLKTLEEPPSHAIFILATTEKHKIIPTILSRCQIFDFNRIRIEDIVKRLEFVARNESVTAEEEALHVIAQKADGALRDALSIFDQMVSFSGKKITYADVIQNLNVLDYEYYFRSVDAALDGDITKILMIFNEVLDKGFDGHNYVAGLNSHLRDLLVSTDQVTLSLLEATPSVRQRYMKQASKSPVSFLISALESGSACDLAYKNSKNQRLHVELFLLKLCRMNGEGTLTAEKKKPDSEILNQPEPDQEVRSAREPVKEPVQSATQAVTKAEPPAASASRSSRSFSVRDVISEDPEAYRDNSGNTEHESVAGHGESTGEEFSNEKFMEAFRSFAEMVADDSPRVASMFKSITTEIISGSSVTLHLSNSAQRDLFVQNYRQKLVLYLENIFGTNTPEIDAKVDQSESDEIIYSDEQKYNYLVSKYPSIKEIRKAFNLDFE